MPRDKFDLDFSNIHKSVFPTDIRESDRVVARIRLRDDQGSFTPIQVWKLSPLGIELVHDPKIPFEKGDKVDLEITLVGQRTYFEGLVVELIRENEHIRLIGIRLSAKNAKSTNDSEKRRSVRWLCSEDYFPTCVAPTPGRYNEYIYFQIRDISRQGVQLLCSLRNKYLIPGTQLNLSASFPMVGDISLIVTVTRVGITSERGKDYLVVGTEFSELPLSAKNVIGQYLLQFTDAESLTALRDAGYLPNSVSKGTDLYFLKSEDDYNQVLALRLKAHLHGGTVKPSMKAVDMGDRYDSNSRIVVGKRKGEIIATVRVHFNVLDEPMEHEQFIDWPAELPRRDQIVELSRACTDPRFRRNDLFASLFRFMSTTCLQPQRPWIVLSSIESLRDFYFKCGFKDTGITYVHPKYQGTQYVLIGNAYDMFLGKSPHPLYWNYIWKEVLGYLIETGLLKPDPMDRARIRVLKLMYPFGKLWFRLTSRV